MTRELMNHQRRREVGRVDRALGSTTPGVRFALREQGRTIVATPVVGIRRQHANRFAEHSAVRPKLTTGFDGTPDGPPRGNAVDATKKVRPDFLRGAKAILDFFHGQQMFDLLTHVPGGLHFRSADVVGQVRLTRDVRTRHFIKVNQLNLGNTQRRQLNRHLPADRAETNNRRPRTLQALRRH